MYHLSQTKLFLGVLLTSHLYLRLTQLHCNSTIKQLVAHSLNFRTLDCIQEDFNTTMTTLNLQKIGRNFVKRVPSMEEVKLESLWTEQTVVLTFLRRFG